MPVTIYRRGKIWHYRGSVAGRRLRGSTRSADKERAQRIAAEEEARAWKCRLDGPSAALTFADAAMLYLSAGKSPRYVRQIMAYWKETPVAKITAGAILQSAVVLYPTACGATRNRQVIVPTQAIINHAAQSELCQKISVKRFTVETKVKRPATWTWVTEFMSSATPRLGALACFMFLTGARISEALALTWSDVELVSDGGTGSALIRQTKVGAERRAHLPSPLVVAVANIPGPRQGSVFGFRSRSGAHWHWLAACKRAGIEPLSFHACRHGFATTALQAGIDVITVAKLGGWQSPAHVFKTYGHANEDRTLTDRLVGTNLTQPARAISRGSRKA